MNPLFIGRLASEVAFIHLHLLPGYIQHVQEENKAGVCPLSLEDFKASVISELFSVPLVLN